jgi:hypothetical protein
MIVCLYGRSAAPFVDPVVAELQHAAARRNRPLEALAIEDLLRDGWPRRDVERVYVLPFEVPAARPAGLPPSTGALMRELFPAAAVINRPEVHDLCWDKLATVRRLLERGVPVPETLITNSPEEARDFVRRRDQAILKEPRSCAGQGHLVLFAGEGGDLGGETNGRRYVVELAPSPGGRRLDHGVLTVPPPYFLQRLVAGVGRHGVLTPGQILRAYVVDGRDVLWTERYRDRVRRPCDFIVSASLGARYRFLPAVSEEARKLAVRTVEALDVRIGAVDLIHVGGTIHVLEADTDGEHMIIDRSFKTLPEFRAVHDFDDYVVQALVAKEEPILRPPRPPSLEPPAPRRERVPPRRAGVRPRGRPAVGPRARRGPKS